MNKVYSEEELSAAVARAVAEKDAEILALHRKFAAETLRADQGWARYEQANKSRMALEMERVAQAAPVAASDLHAWEALRADVLHGVDGLDNDQVNIVLGMIDYYTPTQQPAEVPAEQCRTDGRCQYAIDHGAEGLGACRVGKCCIPAQPPAGELPVLPEPVDELAEADGFNVIGTVEVFTADQMHAFYNQGRVVGREDAVALIERQIANENMDTSGLGARMRIIDAIRALNKTGA